MGTVKEADIVIAKFDYKATDSQELDIQKGEKLTLMDDTQHWWKVMNSLGNVGYVPSNYVKRSKQGLFSSLRNTLGRRKSRTDIPMPSTGTSTGGRPPAPTYSSNRNGSISIGAGPSVKASSESLDYVAPSLPSSGSGQSPSKAATTLIGYQPVSSAFSTNGANNISDTPHSSSVQMSSSHQLPPTHPGMRDVSPSKVPPTADNVALSNSAKNGSSSSKVNSTSTTWPSVISSQGTPTETKFPSSRSGMGSTGGNVSGGVIPRQICVARFTYKASQPDELTLKPGDRICVQEKSSDGWWHGILLTPDGDNSIDLSGQRPEIVGWFPSNYVEPEHGPNKNPAPSSAAPSGNQAPAQMPPVSMGARTSAPMQTQGNFSTGQNVPMSHPHPQESVAGQQLPLQSQQPISTEAYSAVPFPTPTLANANNAFAQTPSQPQQQYPQQVLMQTQNQQRQYYSSQKNQQQHMVPPFSGYPCSNPSVPTPAAPVNYTAGSNGNNAQLLPYIGIKAPVKPTQPKELVRAMYSFTKNEPAELSFQAGEELEVLDKPVDDQYWWLCRNSKGDMGLVPTNYITAIGDSVVPPPPSQIQPMPATINPRAEEVRRTFLRGSQNTARFGTQPWYWGSISRYQCECLLGRLGTEGDFFVRDSETHPGDLTITMKAGLKNRNFKITVKNGEYQIGLKVFTSLDTLIEYYRRHPIFKNDREKYSLTLPFQHPECRTVLSAAVDKLLEHP